MLDTLQDVLELGGIVVSGLKTMIMMSTDEFAAAAGERTTRARDPEAPAH
ncbi:MAG: hypothetical protein U0793_15785 [Gemmataceae bacterium]